MSPGSSLCRAVDATDIAVPPSRSTYLFIAWTGHGGDTRTRWRPIVDSMREECLVDLDQGLLVVHKKIEDVKFVLLGKVLILYSSLGESS